MSRKGSRRARAPFGLRRLRGRFAVLALTPAFREIVQDSILQRTWHEALFPPLVLDSVVFGP